MNILILGSGAREHALARTCAKSALTRNSVCRSRQSGLRDYRPNRADQFGRSCEGIAICRREAIDLVVVGPEGPLVSGLADDLLSAGVLCFGPTR